MSEYFQCLLVALVMLLLAFVGCDTIPTAREMELQRGNCHACKDEVTGEDGWCCERQINAELICEWGE